MTPALAAFAFLALAPKPIAAVIIPTAAPPARAGKPPYRLRSNAYIAGTGPEDARPPLRPVRSSFQFSPATNFPDVVEIVFLAQTRPVRVQATVIRHGKPLADAWTDHVRQLFNGFDRDGDGRLNRLEAENLFSVGGLSQLLGGQYYYPAVAPVPTWEDLDRDDDGTASLAEVMAYFAPAADDLLRPRFVAVSSPTTDRLTTDLFARLDLNKDGRLTRDEMKRIEQILTTADADEDECLSPGEILPDLVTRLCARPQRVGEPETPRPLPPADLYVFRGQRAGIVTQQAIKRYDKNDDFKLSRTEIGLPAGEFAAFDADKDGQLSAAELEAWRTGPADFVAVLDIGKTVAASSTKLTPRAGPVAGVEVREGVNGRTVLRVGNQFLDLTASPPPPLAQQNREALNLLSAFPPDKMFVTDADIRGPQSQFLRIVFDAADANGDGKLTRVEYQAYLNLQQSTIDLAVSVTFATRTPGLFGLLDGDGDGRLSVRELRTAFDRLIPLEPSGGDAVTTAAIQPSAAVRAIPSVNIGSDSPGASTPFVAGSRGPSRGPIWFVRMDTNLDGDLSRGEFLGAAADFARIDTNGDGLISLAEAEVIDAATRPTPAKPKAK